MPMIPDTNRTWLEESIVDYLIDNWISLRSPWSYDLGRNPSEVWVEGTNLYGSTDRITIPVNTLNRHYRPVAPVPAPSPYPITQKTDWSGALHNTLVEEYGAPPTISTDRKKVEDMFASRKDEDDSTHRLCIRRGRIIRNTKINGELKMISFKTALLAKTCADELNEEYFDEYDKYIDRDNGLKQRGVMIPPNLRESMVNVILKYATVSPVTN